MSAGSLDVSPTPGPLLDPATLAGLRALQEPGGTDFLSEVVSAFLEDGERHLAEIQQAVASGEPSRLWPHAHGLKGAAGSLGASRVQALSAALEQRGRANALDGAQALQAELRAAFDATAPLLRRFAAGEPIV